jgi:hypothetical protein
MEVETVQILNTVRTVVVEKRIPEKGPQALAAQEQVAQALFGMMVLDAPVVVAVAVLVVLHLVMVAQVAAVAGLEETATHVLEVMAVLTMAVAVAVTPVDVVRAAPPVVQDLL